MFNIRSELAKTLVASAVFALPTLATSAEKDHKEHGAHAHGHGTLEVAAEGEELVLMLRVPGANVVGFEHEPSTDAEREAVHEALERFKAGDKLFAPDSSGDCEFESAKVELAGLEEGEHGHEGHDHEKHEKHDDDKDHDHDKHEHKKDHDHDHEKHGKHEEHEEESHNELHAEYHFHCHKMAKLTSVDVKLFDALSGMDEIEAVVVTESYQGATELSPNNTKLPLSK